MPFILQEVFTTHILLPVLFFFFLDTEGPKGIVTAKVPVITELSVWYDQRDSEGSQGRLPGGSLISPET